MPHLTEILSVLAVLGMAAQWLGWRFKIPVILLLILAGLAVGPVFGLIRPSQAPKDAFHPLVGLAVAVILFEGGLTLRFDELRQAGSGVIRLITLTVLLSWLFGASAGHWVAGLSWPVAAARGRIAFSGTSYYARLQYAWHAGQSFQITEITGKFDIGDFMQALDEGSLPLAVIDENDRITLLGADDDADATAGARVLWFGCKQACVDSD